MHKSSNGLDMGSLGVGVAVEVKDPSLPTMGDRLFSLRLGPA